MSRVKAVCIQSSHHRPAVTKATAGINGNQKGESTIEETQFYHPFFQQISAGYVRLFMKKIQE